MLSFAKFSKEEIYDFISLREGMNNKFHLALQKLDKLSLEMDELLEGIGFSIRPDYSEVYKSIRMYMGIYTSEIMEGRQELSRR